MSVRIGSQPLGASDIDTIASALEAYHEAKPHVTGVEALARKMRHEAWDAFSRESNAKWRRTSG